MNKNEIKALIALKQAEMPFAVKDRRDSLPIDGGQIISIPGVRRCGKSTRMELAINELLKRGVSRERILWVGFDDERLAKMTAEELNLILDAYREMNPEIPLSEVWMFFDELPLVEGWELFVLRVYKSYCKNIFICGSNAHTKYFTFPLSFREFCAFKGIDCDSPLESEQAKVRVGFDEYNRLGGMPEVTLIKSLSLKYKKLQSYFDTMLLKDFVEHFAVSKEVVLRYFLKRVMAGLANPISVNAIYGEVKAQGFKISKDELYVWLQEACAIYLFCRVPKYSRSLAKQEAALAKYYVIDNGFRNAVIPMQSDDDGKQLENTVYLELLRYKGANESISYYQDTAHGCDFVISEEEKVKRLIQVTWDMRSKETRKREIEGIIAAAEALGCEDLVIVTHDEAGELEQSGHKIRIVPAYEMFGREFKG